MSPQALPQTVNPVPLPISYQAAQQAVVSGAIVAQVQIALFVAGAAALAGTGDSNSVITYCYNASPAALQRIAMELIATGAIPTATPTDAQVQTAVNALIPSSGAFQL